MGQSDTLFSVDSATMGVVKQVCAACRDVQVIVLVLFIELQIISLNLNISIMLLPIVLYRRSGVYSWPFYFRVSNSNGNQTSRQVTSICS